MKREVRILRQTIGAVCALTLLVWAHSTRAQEAVSVEQFQDWALTIDVPNVGPFLGSTDLEVQHPFWVSNRPADFDARDPTDSANIAAAWTTDTFTNMRTLDGTLVPGATLHQEWIAVTLAEGEALFASGNAVIGSSGGFLFGLIRQTASPEATAAFGLQTIDNGGFIFAAHTVQGICG